MKLALIVLLDRYADWEVGFLAPLFHMASDDPEWEVWSAEIVSLDKDPIQSMGKLTVLPDYRMATFAGSRYTNQANFVQDARVISDGNIVTADGASPILFTAEVLKTFGVFPEAEVDEWLKVQSMGEKAYYE